MRRRQRVSLQEAELLFCPTCSAMPGEPCRYVEHPALRRPGSTSARVVQATARIGEATKRPHTARHRPPQWRLELWLIDHGHILWDRNDEEREGTR
jgi:hypothetical protein